MASADPDPLPGVFEGLRVLEIGQFVAAPICGELFAHGGADVVKLEPVTGDQTRSTDPLRTADGTAWTDGRQYAVKARGKRALPVDLSSPAGRSIALDLATHADVLITNLRPGTAQRLGLDHESLRTVNPGLVHGEITGFGDTGPDALRPSLDLIAQSWTGLRSATSQGGRMGRYEAYYCDYTAGLLLAFGIAAALQHRERTGEGQRVGTSLAHAGLYLMHRSANLFDATDDWKRSLAERRAAGESLADLADERARRAAPEVFFMSTYDTSDGAVAIGATGPMGARLCRSFGTTDPRTRDEWADRTRRDELLAATRAHLADRLRSLSTDEAMAVLLAEDIPASPVRLVEELLLDPDAHAAGLVYEADHERFGHYVMSSAPITMSGSGYRARPEIADHGEHTDELLVELGYDRDTIERLVADGIVHRRPQQPPADG